MSQAKFSIPSSSGAVAREGLKSVLLSIQSAFDWPVEADDFTFAGHWTTPTGAEMYRLKGSPGGDPDVVLKIGPNGSEGATEASYDEMTRLKAAVDQAGIAGVATPEILGWSASPPALCMSYVEGVDLKDILEAPLHPMWESPQGRLTELLEKCGEALGACHTEPRLPAGEIAAAGSVARHELHAAGRRMRVPESHVEAVTANAPMVSTCPDFAPYNVRLASSGMLYLLDPSWRSGLAFAHKDVAHFAFRLETIVLRARPGMPSTRVRKRIAWLCNAFYGGYSKTGPVDVRTPEGRWLIDLYKGHRAAHVAYRMWGGRRYRESLSAAARAHRYSRALRAQLPTTASL